MKMPEKMNDLLEKKLNQGREFRNAFEFRAEDITDD
jgi:hypothetical protein